MILNSITKDRSLISQFNSKEIRSLSKGFGKRNVNLNVNYNRQILLSAINLEQTLQRALKSKKSQFTLVDELAKQTYSLSTKEVKNNVTKVDSLLLYPETVAYNKMYIRVESSYHANMLMTLVKNYYQVMSHIFNQKSLKEIAAVIYGLSAMEKVDKKAEDKETQQLKQEPAMVVQPYKDPIYFNYVEAQIIDDALSCYLLDHFKQKGIENVDMLYQVVNRAMDNHLIFVLIQRYILLILKAMKIEKATITKGQSLRKKQDYQAVIKKLTKCAYNKLTVSTNVNKQIKSAKRLATRVDT